MGVWRPIFLMLRSHTKSGRNLGRLSCENRAHICHEYHKLYVWRKNLLRGEISAFYTEFEQLMEFYQSLGHFCSKSMWRKICAEKICVEKKRQI